ncbi:MAG: NIPSNAP family protein [Acidobacteria bacterium]|nr:NIPSNAP family protein [Acidobacteriota bacterium]
MYTVRPEGPGNADVNHARFRERFMATFKRLGFDVVGFWQPVSKPDTLIYLLAFQDAATRDALWAKFFADPEWTTSRAEFQVSVQVTQEFMIATDYGPLK